MVELQGVSKNYDGVVALRPTDLQFAEGKTTALIGPSGCGKSTLLRLIIGLISPSSGQVLFDGAQVGPGNLLEVRRKTGYVIQDGGLFPHLTARDNVQLVAKLVLDESHPREMAGALGDQAKMKNEAIQDAVRGALLGGQQGRSQVSGIADPVGAESSRSLEKYGAISTRVEELAEVVRIPKDLLSRFPGELSGGQRQRIGLMRALMLKPKVLLLDEPLAALDPMVRSALQTDLKRIFQELGATVILVTHDMGEAAYLGDTIVLLREGQIVQQGTLEDFQQRPKEQFVDEFLNAQRSLVAL